MTMGSKQPENLFAHELVHILAAHDLDMTQLTDLAGIPSVAVQRIQQSLHDPTFSPVLNLDEMEAMVTTLFISATEQDRLRAALLGTAIKNLLKQQLGSTYARQLTAQIYPLLLDAFLHADPVTLGDTVRGQDHEANEDLETDSAWFAIMEAMDAADLALQLSRGQTSYTEQVHRLKEARMLLDEALAESEDLDEVIQSLPLWRTWRQRIQSERTAVGKRLRALGIEE
ncbi:hypothetical protein [Dictyobacter aurantiacus]|nr:hypothetical protein [Dictyobacter aurantiacus]